MNLLNKVFSASLIFLGTAFIYKVAKSRHSISPSRIPNLSDNVDYDSNTSAIDNDVISRTQKMYKDLGMTDNQKTLYEASMKSIKPDWENKNSSDKIGDRTILMDEDKSLKAVLDEVQYGMYRDWTQKYKS